MSWKNFALTLITLLATSCTTNPQKVELNQITLKHRKPSSSQSVTPDRLILIGTKDIVSKQIISQAASGGCLAQGVRGTERKNSSDSDSNGYIDDIYGWKFDSNGHGIPVKSFAREYNLSGEWIMFGPNIDKATECVIIFPIIIESAASLKDAINYLVTKSDVINAYNGLIEFRYQSIENLPKLLFQELGKVDSNVQSTFLFTRMN